MNILLKNKGGLFLSILVQLLFFVTLINALKFFLILLMPKLYRFYLQLILYDYKTPLKEYAHSYVEVYPLMLLAYVILIFISLIITYINLEVYRLNKLYLIVLVVVFFILLYFDPFGLKGFKLWGPLSVSMFMPDNLIWYFILNFLLLSIIYCMGIFFFKGRLKKDLPSWR